MPAPWSKLIAGCVGIVLLSVVTLPSRAADDDATLERFLDRLGLVELQALHLEQVVERLPEGGSRTAAAERLADLYAEQLIVGSEDSTKYTDVLQRINRLVDKVPKARTAALEIMLLQAEFQRAESLVNKWLTAQSDSAARDAAAGILVRIAPQLDARYQQLQAAVEKLLAEVEAMQEGDARTTKEQGLNRLQTVAGRAAYFAAWSNYYLVRVNPALPQATPALSRSRDVFRKLLGLEGQYKETQPEMLGLESIWRSRALIGLALAEAALGNREGSRICFEWLSHPGAPAEIRDQIAYWRLESLLAAGNNEAAYEFARLHLAQLSGSATPGKVSFCVALIRAAFAGQKASPVARELGMRALAALVKMRRMDVAGEVLKTFAIPRDTNPNFFLRWLRGHELLQQAENEKSADRYRAAATELAAALEAPDARQEIGAAAQCRYQLGWCLYQLGRFEEAARAYEQAVPGLQAAGDNDAVQAAWMTFRACRAMADSQPRFVAAAVDALNRIKREFPNHPYAKQADYQISKLRERTLPLADTLAQLQKVPPTSPNYADAQYDICVRLHRQWRESKTESASTLASQVLAAADRYLGLPREKDDAPRKLHCAMLAVAVALDGAESHPAQAAAHLDKAGAFVPLLPASSPLVAEYNYRRLQMAGLNGNESGQRQHADWLAQNARGSPYELTALLTLAKNLEANLRAADATRAAPLREQAFASYQRLSEILGTTPEVLKANKNARVANSRAAELASQRGKHEEAASRLDQLLQAFPSDPGYLRRAGLAHFHAGHYERALEIWRTLLDGLERGSDAWYEAKYYQLACLFRIDEARAKPAWEQFKLLCPDLGPPAWRDRFKALESKR